MGDTPHSDTSRDLGELRRTLEDRRRELSRQMFVKIRDVREASEGGRHVNVAEEFAPKDIHDDLDATLIQMKSETLLKIDGALRLIEEGRYGTCSECGGHITQARLMAIPFALRCTACQDVHEKRSPLQRHDGIARLGWRGVGDDAHG